MAQLLPPSDIRKLVADKILEAMGADGWKQSIHPHPAFPGFDTSKIEAKAFAVGVQSTRPLKSRQDGYVLVESSVSVRYSRALKATLQVASFDEAMDAELKIVAAVSSISSPDADVTLLDIPTRTTVADGTVYLGEIRFVARTVYPLA